MSSTFKYTHDVLIYPISLVLLLWIVYWVEIKFSIDFTSYGIYPLRINGLRGILFSTFIHGSLNHLVNNSLPLLLLSMALFYFYNKHSKVIILFGILSTGILTWLIGRPSYHIGASGLVYVLASFLFFKGIFSKYYRLVALSLSVVFVYGSMVWGLFPAKESISWEGHLSGFLVGFIFALVLKTNTIPKVKYEWEKKNYNEKEDEFMQLFDEDGNFSPQEWNEKDSENVEKESTIVYHYKEDNK